MCLVRAPLDESTEAHIVHFWGWRDPGFCWLGLLLPFVDFLTGTSSDEDDVWSTSLSWISSSASLSLKTTFSWRSSLSNRIWPDKVFILRRVSIKIVSPAERSVLLPVPPQSASLSVEITPHTYILAGDWVYLMIDCSKWSTQLFQSDRHHGRHGHFDHWDCHGRRHDNQGHHDNDRQDRCGTDGTDI